jgi:hypothetical protein
MFPHGLVPVFVTVTVKVTVPPSCTELGSAVLVIDRAHPVGVDVGLTTCDVAQY